MWVNGAGAGRCPLIFFSVIRRRRPRRGCARRHPGLSVASDKRRFSDFYRFYLSEHSDPANRRMHFIGTAGGLAALIAALVWANPWLIPAGLVFGYGCAWFGHARFEKNRPATFRHPFYSFAGDWVMFKDILLGRLSIRRR